MCSGRSVAYGRRRGGDEGDRRADRDADNAEHQPLADDQRDDVAGLRA